MARFTPDAAIRVFERGELRLDVTIVTVVVVATLLVLTVIWLRTGTTGCRRGR